MGNCASKNVGQPDHNGVFQKSKSPENSNKSEETPNVTANGLSAARPAHVTLDGEVRHSFSQG